MWHLPISERPGSRFVAASGIGLWLFTVLSYAGTLRNEFVNLDDNGYVTQNPHVAEGLTSRSLAYAWTTFDLGNWIPITWMSYELDATLFGIQSTGFHATNVFLHSLNVLLLWIWLWRLTSEFWPSWIVAALFAAHPLHVESVAWVAERKDLLSLTFFLGALLAHEAYLRQRSAWHYGWITIWLALGLLSKSMLVTAPLLMLLIEHWRASARSRPLAADAAQAPEIPLRRRVREKLPWLAMSLAIGIVTIQAQGAGAVSAFTSFGRLPMSDRIPNAICGYGWYLWKTLVPTGLCAMYAHPLQDVPWPQVMASAAGLLVVSGYVLACGRHRPSLIFGWGWYLLSALPVIGLLQVGTQAYADRYSYLPQIGLLVLLVWEAQCVLRQSTKGPSLATVSVGLLLAVFAGLTMRQVTFWRTTEAMWARALEVDPHNWAVHQWMGRHALSQERWPEAISHLEEAVTRNPKLPKELRGLAFAHAQLHQSDDAIRYYRLALQVSPGDTDSMHGLLDTLRPLQRSAEALPELEQYLLRQPGDVKSLQECGLILARQGDIENAVAWFAQVVELEPDNFSARMNLGVALANLNRNAEAKIHSQRAVELRPESADARVNLGALFQAEREYGAAIEQFEAALRLNPNDQEARERLAALKPTAPP